MATLSGCLSKNHLPQPQTGNFTGQVVDAQTNEALPGVTVVLCQYHLITDIKGNISIADLAPGNYQIQLNRTWYVARTVNLSYVGVTQPIKIELVPQSLPGGILYSSDINGEREIFRLDLATRQNQKVFEESGSSKTNPVGIANSQVIFQAKPITKDGNNDIFCFDMQSKLKRLLYGSSDDEQHPSVDATGYKMAFAATGGKVYLYDLISGGSPQFIAKGQNPVINRDGTRIAFVSNDYKFIWVYNILSNQSHSYEYTGHKVNNPCWSPDGLKIAFKSYETSDSSRYIYYFEPDAVTLQIYRLTYSYRSIDSHEHPCWSKDGKIIYFNGNIMYSTRKDIYGIRFEDSLLQKENAPWVMVSSGSGNKDYPSYEDF